MFKTKLTFISSLLLACSCAGNSSTSTPEEAPGLYKAFEDKFLLGTALNGRQISGEDSLGQAAALKHFNSFVAENVMKCEEIHPERDRYFWADADAFIKLAEDNGKHIVGHCLIWHSQCAPWFFKDEKGERVSAATLKRRMRDHIHAVVGRYKGRVKGWDVVNEAIVEDGSFRKSPFYEILGEEFIPLAFEYAHEADPDAELYLNDYGMNVPGRRDTYVRLAREMKAKGLRLDAIGMQSHIGMDYPDLKEYEAAMDSFINTGCKVMITELDMSALPTVYQGANISEKVDMKKELNPYTGGLPDSVSNAWNDRMREVFDIYLRHADDITRVTAWGVTDGDSWKNGFPVSGRTDYPLLLDRDYNPKPFLTQKQ